MANARRLGCAGAYGCSMLVNRCISSTPYQATPPHPTPAFVYYRLQRLNRGISLKKPNLVLGDTASAGTFGDAGTSKYKECDNRDVGLELKIASGSLKPLG